MPVPTPSAARRALDVVAAYWPLLGDDALTATRGLLTAAATASPDTLEAARGRLWAALSGRAFRAFLLQCILDDAGHPCLRYAAASGPDTLPEALRRRLVDDLRRWQSVAAAVDAALPASPVEAAAAAAPGLTDPLSPETPPWSAVAARGAWRESVAGADDWGARADALIELIAAHGLGAEQGCVAYRFEVDAGCPRLTPLHDVDAFDLDWLTGNRERIEVVEANTRNLLDGFRAHNTLIWGPRGCGKSSLIRGLLTRYADAGLRGIEIPVTSYAHLGRLFDLVRGRRERFLGILDNVGLERTDLATRSLSTALDGGLERMPGNLVFYATSNFKDLVDRGGERPQGPPATQVDDAPEALRHTDDAGSRIRRGFDPQGFQRLDERRALDDRFALKVFIDMPTKSEYERIVIDYARRVGIDTDDETLLADFQVWRMRHNHDLVGGRTARDYVLARYPEHVRAAAGQARC